MDNKQTLIHEYFDDNQIDIIEMGKKHFTGYPGARRFGRPILYLVDDIVKSHAPIDELLTYRECVCSMLKRLTWHIGIGPIPLMRQEFCMSIEEPIGKRLASSIILTALTYRQSLDEPETNLRYIMLGDFLRGIEWGCAISRSEGLDCRDDLPLLKLDEVAKFINFNKS